MNSVIIETIVSVAANLAVTFIGVLGAWLLAQTGNVQNVWWAFPIAEIMSLILSVYFYRRINKNIVMKL